MATWCVILCAWLPYLTQCFWDQSMCFSVFHCQIIFPCLTLPHVFSHLSGDDHWFVSNFWLLCIMLLWAFMYELLYRWTFLFLLGIYLGMALLSHRGALYLTFLGNDRLFSKEAELTCNPTSSAWGFQFFYVLVNHFYLFLILAILMGVKWCLLMAVIYISLTVNEDEYLFMCFFCHLFIFLEEISVQILCPLWFVFLLRSC